jgi:hypothetical protein
VKIRTYATWSNGLGVVRAVPRPASSPHISTVQFVRAGPVVPVIARSEIRAWLQQQAEASAPPQTSTLVDSPHLLELQRLPDCPDVATLRKLALPVGTDRSDEGLEC